MKYFIDTEFIEGFHKPLFGKKRHFIDLISIGIKCEDGREYYAISNEFNPKDANQWVKDNVLSKLGNRYQLKFGKYEIDTWKSNQQIKEDIIEFCSSKKKRYSRYGKYTLNAPEFYGYYSDYDWVLFCSLFGTMMDLPEGFPMYCRDLKQSMDEAIKKWSPEGNLNNPELINCFKQLKGFPTQEDEHNALSDAKWNEKLYNFLKTF